MSQYVKFLANKEVLKQLDNMQTFFGCSTKQKLFERIIPYAINKIAAQSPPPNLSKEQEAAFAKLEKYHTEVCKSVGLLWPSLVICNEDEEEEDA